MIKPAPKVLANADAVIQLLAQDGALNHAEIADRTGIPRPSVYRLVDGLAAISLVEPRTDGTIGLGPRCLQLADAARATMREWEGADRTLLDLASQTHLTAYLSVRSGDEAMCVEWAQGRDFAILLLRPGRTLPLHAPVEGRVLLAYATDIHDYVRSDALTSPTTPDVETLVGELDRIRDRGYAETAGEVTVGVGALAVPVRDPSGTVVACVSVAGFVPAVRSNRDTYLASLKTAAQRLEETLAAS